MTISIDILKTQLKDLKEKNNYVGLFCLLCAERMFLIYKNFSIKYSIPYSEYAYLVDKAFLIAMEPNQYDLKLIKNKFDKFAIDTEDFSDVLADQAQCAEICMMYSLEYLSTGDLSMANYCIDKVFEALEIYEYEYETENSEANREKEKKWMQSILSNFNLNTEISEEELNALRKTNKQNMIPSI